MASRPGCGSHSPRRARRVRRISEVAKLFTDSGIINLTAFISPYISDRLIARQLIGDGSFIEVFVDCPLEICEQRDPKGSYKKARGGIIKEFTGISAPYEQPENPEIHLRTDLLSVADGVQDIMRYLEQNDYISRQ